MPTYSTKSFGISTAFGKCCKTFAPPNEPSGYPGRKVTAWARSPSRLREIFSGASGVVTARVRGSYPTRSPPANQAWAEGVPRISWAAAARIVLDMLERSIGQSPDEAADWSGIAAASNPIETAPGGPPRLLGGDARAALPRRSFLSRRFRPMLVSPRRRRRCAFRLGEAGEDHDVQEKQTGEEKARNDEPG